MITIVLWKWHKPGYRTKFTPEMVNVMCRMIKRNVTVPHRVVCITDDAAGIECETLPLWPNPAPHYGTAKRPNCFYRLKAFAPEMRDVLGERFMWLDLDTVITRNIDHLLTEKADFGIWRVDFEISPCNGSMVLHRTGSRPELWANFDASVIHPVNGYRHKTGMIGSDQAWIAQNLRPATDRYFSIYDGVYSYRCHLANKTGLPQNAAIVFFHGEHNPGDSDVKRRHAWVREHYR
jgi:hypothetical protein